MSCKNDDLSSDSAIQRWRWKVPVSSLLALILVWMALGHSDGQTGEQPLDVEHIERFLANITGVWQGKAVLTPVGPLPYNIHFTQLTDGSIEGAADPGAATHYWRFSKTDDGVKLRFLSTFRGNKEPMHLLAKTRLVEAVVFRAHEPSYLEVHVSPAAQGSFIRVFLRNKLHVEILLER